MGSTTKTYPARDIYHVKGLSSDGVVGYDIITLMAGALSVGMAAQRHGAKFFGQGSNMSGILQVPGHWNEEKLRNTAEVWKKTVGGMANAHKVALLQDGVKWQPYSISPEQAQFLQTRNYEIRGTVANITGCPPHKLGDDSRTSHSSLEAENQSYLDECLDRWLRKHELEATIKLLSERERASESHFVEFNRKALLRMSSQDRANYYAKLQEHGDMTVNDVLRAENMATIGEQGDRRYRPGNLLEIGEEPDGPVQSQPPPQQAPPTPEPEPEPAPEPEEEPNDLLTVMVETNVAKACKIETDRVVKAAAKEANFVAWLDKFYTDWVVNSSVSTELRPAYTAHAAASKSALLDVAGSATLASLPGAVKECVATWSDRGDKLTTSILRSDNND